jgi:hypothetical protein
MKKKPAKKSLKRKPKLHSREDFNQATHRVMQEVIRRSEEICSTLPKP